MAPKTALALWATLAATLVAADAAVPSHLDLALLRELNPDRDSNQAISPFLLTKALSQLWLGATGRTQFEIGDALGISGLGHLGGYTSASTALSRNSSVTTALFNRLYLREYFSIKPLFRHGITSIYGGDLETFSSIPEAVETINTDVARVTNDRITGLVSQESLQGVALVLVEAFYFTGFWKEKFKTTNTGEFLAAQGKKEVLRLTLETSLLYYKSEDYDVVSLPYADNNYTLLVFRPSERSQTSVSKLYDSIGTLNVSETFNQMRNENVTVTMPTFKIEAEYQLKSSLDSLGIKQMFTGEVDFSSISEIPFKVDQVIHKVFMEMNEEGARPAPSITTVHAVPPSLDPSTIYFTVDRPFLAVLYHTEEELNMFSAWVNDPVTPPIPITPSVTHGRRRGTRKRTSKSTK